MSKSLLAAIHNAVAGSALDTLDESETGAAALHSQMKDDNMSNGSNPPAGGDGNTGISQASHDAAVSAARSEGKTEGEKLATDRLSTAMGFEGVKGDAGRMSAALDLAMKSPAMSGADVAAFVVANVSATGAAPAKSSTETYSSQRSSAAALAQPGGGESGATSDFEKGKQKASRFKKT